MLVHCQASVEIGYPAWQEHVEAVILLTALPQRGIWISKIAKTNETFDQKICPNQLNDAYPLHRSVRDCLCAASMLQHHCN